LGELALFIREIVLGIYGIHRAFRYAQGAVDALIGVNNKEVRPLVKAVYRTYLDTVGVFAANAAFRDNVRHLFSPPFRKSAGA
jgi:hypothetical protein